MTTPLLNEHRSQFEKSIAHLKEELASLRSGRANAAILDKVTVEAYGAQQPIKALASIAVPDAKTIAIEPWDAGVVKDIERALAAADLGITPTVQGKIIRLVMPQMTEERRSQLTKVVREKAEEARQSIRAVREKVRDNIMEMEKANEMTEDDRFRAQEELDKITKEFTERIDKMAVEKEKEMMTV